ncbi:uncharacterized protein LOC18053476 isoform X2 [Citrus clementina]|uniref:uncharacterized protein LOC18053476 isoform X2 n=1 Tax=Citrus clementina TaxID=85681 RepID=UPI000CED2A9E|nr:uncharacterized protein LOC18053476 isoform X2 [Citrus x clementina]
MGVSDGGMRLQLEGDRSDVAAYLDKYNATSSGINVKTLADILQNSREANDEFKVTFMLFTLCTILCPPIGVHISSSFLYSLKDTEFISKRNWASFDYDKLIQGITRYKEDHLAYVSGCVLYLEMFCNSIVYGGLRRDRSISPIALWNGCEIKRLIKWIEKKCGYGSIKVTVPLNAGTMKTSAGGSCIHSEQDCTNQSSIRQPTDTVNDPLSNLISQYRAGPFVVARSLEHIDIKLIKYIMNEDLEEGETIVQTDKHCLSRNCMLSLAPTRLINVKPQVVSGEGLLQRWVEENVTLTHKNNDLHTYERIIVPVNQ